MLNKPRKLFASMGSKAIICLICLAICLASVSFALVTYTSTVTITPVVQLSVGTATTSWTIYQNEQNTKYMPGGSTETTLAPADTSTYAFEVATDANKVCAVEVELTSAMDPSKFSSFDITVLSSSGGAWTVASLYTGPTGSTTTPYIDGLTQGAAAYIHQGLSLTMYYEIQVTYSYDGNSAPLTATFQFTPLPLNSF
jgi:hypothetical protein